MKSLFSQSQVLCLLLGCEKKSLVKNEMILCESSQNDS